MWKNIMALLMCLPFTSSAQDTSKELEVKEGDKVVLVTKDGDSLIVPKEVRDDVLQILDNQAKIDSLNKEIRKEHYKQKKIVAGIEQKLTKLANQDFSKFLKAMEMVKNKIPKKDDHRQSNLPDQHKQGVDNLTAGATHSRYILVLEENYLGHIRKFIMVDNEKVYLS